MACTVITIPRVISSGSVPGTSASPGLQYGRAGNIAAPTYLQGISTVPSNTAGLIVPFDGFITKIWATAEDDDTFSLQVQERTGNVFTDLAGAVISLVASRKQRVNVLVSVLDGWELVMYMPTGSARNIQAGIIIEQSP